jgi:hypothetical protein
MTPARAAVVTRRSDASADPAACPARMVQDEVKSAAVMMASGHRRNPTERWEGEMRTDLVVGGRFPDLELPDHREESVKLGKLADGFPLIVSFYRGYW